MSREEFNDLVARLKKGDNSALLYLQAYRDACMEMLITKSAYRCTREQAYDIVLDSFLDFRRNVLLDRVTYQNIPAYVRRICWNKWLSMARQGIREEKESEAVRELYYRRAETTDMLSAREELHERRMAQIEAAMQQLSERGREILCLSIADGLSMKEIADRLGLASPDVAKTLKSRNYKKLLEIIRQMEEA
jgi:RNA polymerase sigma factor (sigma-70 family)